MTTIHNDRQSQAISELCALVFSIIRLPPCDDRRPPRQREVTPGGLASLLLGMSLALMTCGWVTFMIGFMLMPWVLGMVTVLYLVGMVSNISALGRSFVCAVSAAGPSPSSSRSCPGQKEMSGQLVSKLQII